MVFAHAHSPLASESRVLAKFREAERLLALDPEGRDVFRRLNLLRARLAKEARVPAFRILSHAQLLELSERRPRNEGELTTTRGIGALLVRAYGDEIVATVISEISNIID